MIHKPLLHIPDPRAATPTPADPDSDPDPAPAVQIPNSSEPDSFEGQSFAKRIVAEILDRSVIKYQDSLVVECKEGEGGEEGKSGESGGHKNYINYDIAQTVLGTSRDAERQESHSEGETEEREGSKTPTG